MHLTDIPPALPLWIDGHAYLTVTPAFLDVCNPRSGEVLRRIPLCAAEEVNKALASAQGALAAWAAVSAAQRRRLLADTGDALAAYVDHFVRLIADETGDEALAGEEVANAIAVLRDPAGDDAAAADVLAVVGDARHPLVTALRLVVAALLGGSTVVVRPCPEAPSALLALAELASRCALPPGVFNIVYGGDATVAGLRAVAGLDVVPA